ncbi:hypothetical protein [Methylobacterium sp. JK268]
MRRLSVLSLLAVALAAGPALAQSQRTTTPAERTVDSLNSSMNSRSEIRGIQEQNRFEQNQIRGDIQRQQSMPAPPAAPGIVVGRPR